MFRVVGGAVDYGDAHRPVLQELRRLPVALHHLQRLRCPHSLHPPHHGRPLSLPACAASALVSLSLHFTLFRGGGKCDCV